MIGRIVNWNVEKGYGFIQALNHRNYFGHATNWEDQEPPVVGRQVSFELKEVRNGRPPECINIKYTVDDSYIQLMPESGTLVTTTVVR